MYYRKYCAKNLFYKKKIILFQNTNVLTTFSVFGDPSDLVTPFCVLGPTYRLLDSKLQTYRFPSQKLLSLARLAETRFLLYKLFNIYS